MAAYRRVYDSRHLQADFKEPGSAPEPYDRQSSMGYLYLYLFRLHRNAQHKVWPVVTDVASRGLCVLHCDPSVCLSGGHKHESAETDERIEIPFGMR